MLLLATVSVQMLVGKRLGQTCEQNFWYMYVCLTQWAVGCLATETFFTSETDRQEVKKTYSVILHKRGKYCGSVVMYTLSTVLIGELVTGKLQATNSRSHLLTLSPQCQCGSLYQLVSCAVQPMSGTCTTQHI